jgi:hypothetical protein
MQTPIFVTWRKWLASSLYVVHQHGGDVLGWMNMLLIWSISGGLFNSFHVPNSHVCG